MDAIFHGIGIIGAVTESPRTTSIFLILTLVTKYIAITEAIANPYFWPYAVWSVVVSIVGGIFFKDLQNLKKIKKHLAKKCPHCPHCNNLGYVPPSLPSQPEQSPTTYPQPHQQVSSV